MTHDDWLTSADPQARLAFLRDRGKLSERKARLFACACCRDVGYLLRDKRSKLAVRVAERFADGSVTAKRMAEVRMVARQAAAEWSDAGGRSVGRAFAEEVAYATTWERADQAAAEAAELAVRVSIAEAREPGQQAREQSQCERLRDIFGDPFRTPSSLAPSVLDWGGGRVLELARQIYDGRAFEHMLALADALELAGSTDEWLLQHLRGGGVHAKGCDWLDVILGLR